jgi:flap endonuclease-1
VSAGSVVAVSLTFSSPQKRLARRQLAEAELAKAKEQGSEEDVEKYSKELLRLMGVPVVNAPCEAEAQCAELARKNRVYATATEDMDALTFKTPKLLRKLTFSQVSLMYLSPDMP